MLSATKNGYGKRSSPEVYPRKGRGGQGVIDIKTTERNGPVVGAVQVRTEDEIMMITDAGTLVRTAVAEVSQVGRNTQGVRLIRLGKKESLVELTAVDEEAAATDEGNELDAGVIVVGDAIVPVDGETIAAPGDEAGPIGAPDDDPDDEPIGDDASEE